MPLSVAYPLLFALALDTLMPRSRWRPAGGSGRTGDRDRSRPERRGNNIGTAITATTNRTADIQKLVWALQAAPELLNGGGAHAPFPMVLRLIGHLYDVGATIICHPACGRCGRVVTLSKQADGLRICRNCKARSRAVACRRCGDVREPAARATNGAPLCSTCLSNDPINHEHCIRCRHCQNQSANAASTVPSALAASPSPWRCAASANSCDRVASLPSPGNPGTRTAPARGSSARAARPSGASTTSASSVPGSTPPPGSTGAGTGPHSGTAICCRVMRPRAGS